MKKLTTLVVVFALAALVAGCDQSHKSRQNQYNQSHEFYSLGNWVKSIHLLIPLIDESIDQGDYNLAGDAYYLKAYNYINLVQPDSALTAFYDAQDAYHLAGNDLQYATVTSEIGILYSKNWAFDIAKIYYTNVVEMADEINNDRLKADAYNNIGYCLRMMNDYLDAYVYLDKALDIELTLDNPKYVADIYLEQGLCQYNSKNYDIAAELFWKALKIGKEYNLDQTVGKSYTHIGQVKIAQGDTVNSDLYFDKALAIFNATSPDRTLVLLNKGRLNYLRRDYKTSMNYYAQALAGNPAYIDIQDAYPACDSLIAYYKSVGRQDSALIYAEQLNGINRYVSAQQNKLKLANSMYDLRAMHYYREYQSKLAEDRNEKILFYSIMSVFITCSLIAFYKLWMIYGRKIAPMSIVHLTNKHEQEYLISDLEKDTKIVSELRKLLK